MAKQHFDFAYIDAFAGTGYISREQGDNSDNSLFLDLGLEEPQLCRGKPTNALQLKKHPIFSPMLCSRQ
jgi:hypothetical protein